MNKIKFISLAAGLSLALAFTSCIPNNATEDEHGGDGLSGKENSSSSSAEEDNSSSSVSEISSSSTEPISHGKADGNCYWYEDGNGKYDYKCGFEPPCYTDPSCPECDVCYTYPTECAQNDLDRQTYKCRDVSNPGQFKLVGKDHCCGPSYCYSEGNEPVLCDDACHPPIAVGLSGIKSLLPLYACYVEKRSSSSSAEIKFSSSSVEIKLSSSSTEPGNCYWYEDGNGKYDYKCGFEPPCYKDPSCPTCTVCYPYPTECEWLDAPCLREPKYIDSIYGTATAIMPVCRQVYECKEVSDPGKFKLVGKDACCSPSYCYSEGNESAGCPAVCTPPIAVGLNGIESGQPFYTCYKEKPRMVLFAQ